VSRPFRKPRPTQPTSLATGDLLSQLGFCEQSAQRDCIMPRVVNDQAASDAIDQCRDACHIQCDSWRFKAAPSTMALNALAFRHLLPTPHSDLLQLELAYRALEYKEFIQSYAISLDTFVGNLGGQITLWIGGSMITLINVPIAVSAFLFRKSVARARSRLFWRQQATQSAVQDLQGAIGARLHR